LEDVFYHLLETGMLTGMYVWYRNMPDDHGYYCSHFRGECTAFWPLPGDTMMGLAVDADLLPAPWFVVQQWEAVDLVPPVDVASRDPSADDPPL